ncbi:hypothetical protein I5907_08715 [Panacibacter sp. DH6]|uniref:Uncharacterized protein n=1 Tax=Panacibacter microcysteis TaxID=2793269 RepID=A0A931GVE6_9BACT|nr:hypothetical protein [Panacibacter microcysteis]MBG9376315.1 hypothetical protein [Panacibacter microcysteis]
MKILKPALLLLFPVIFFVSNVNASVISDSAIKIITARFEKLQYKLDKSITPAINNTSSEMPAGDAFPCYTDKEVLVVAVLDTKPGELVGRMLVSKKYNGKIEYDKHLFQNIGYDEGINAYYSLLSVMFPKESNNFNCMATLQIYDKQHLVKDIRLLIFTR